MLKEFKEFAFKGNLIDIAVGMAIAAAFGKITDAFVNGIFMPILGRIFQIGDLSQWKIVLAQASGEAPEVAITYGTLIQNTINFLIIAFVMFWVIKVINATKKQEEAVPAAPAGPTQEELLAEIRDLLKK